jgi:hypothetical protein
VVCKVLLATSVRQARWVSRVCLVSPVPSVLWANRVHSDLRANLVLSAFVVSKERSVLEACVGLLVQLVLLVLLVFVVRQGLLACKASRVLLVSRVILVLKESRVILDLSDPRAPLVWLVPLA